MSDIMQQSPFPIQPFNFGAENPIEPSQGVDADFEVSRRNLMVIMETTSGAIKSLSLIAFQSQLPEAYDVLNKMIKTYNDQQEQLIRMYRIRDSREARQATTTSPSVQGEVVDNRTQNVFLGTPAQLAEVLENMKTQENK